MKNLVVANLQPDGKTGEAALRRYVDAQIENSLALGWKQEDLVVVTNMDCDQQVTVIRAELNQSCLTGSKMFALDQLFALGLIAGGEVWWAHDLDAWQNYWFEPPTFADIALAEYSTPRFNGGSVFLRSSARDLIETITTNIRETRAQKEEPAINRVLRAPQNFPRVTTLNSTYNVGCSAYAVRHQRSEKPILVSHFNPAKRGAWRTHVLGDAHVAEGSVCARLHQLLGERFHGVSGDFANNPPDRKRIPLD